VPIATAIAIGATVGAADVIATAAATAAGGATADVAPGAPVITTLANGLRVVSEHVPGALSASAGVWVGVGARDESPELSGVSHFLEHLLFKGTPERSAREISTAVDRVGGDMNAFTAKEFTAYYCRVPARCLSLSLDVLGDVLSRPALRAGDVDSERQVILEELAMDDDAPDDTVYRLFGEAMFPDHALGRDTAGSPDTVEAISPDDVRAFFAEHYRADAMVVAVAGAVDHDRVVAEVERAFAPATTGAPPLDRRAPDSAPLDVAGEERDCEQVHLVVGVRAFDRHDPDREALDVLSHVVGGGPSSRLFQSIREDRGLCYSTYTSSSTYADAGTFAAYAATTPEHAGEVLSLVHGELDRVARHGITDDELEIAKGYLTGAYEMGFEGTGSRIDRLGGLLTLYGSIRSIDEQVRRWNAVTGADVSRVIDRILRGGRLVCSVGPVDPSSLS
jgi:predicted Zn-dependent peptidase